MTKLYIALALLLASSIVHADSIRIGGELHKNVYIGKSKQYYYVHYPEEGRIEKVIRKRRDVSDVKFDSDESGRKRLLKQFKARNAEYYEKRKETYARRNSRDRSDFGAYLDRRDVDYYRAAEETEKVFEGRKVAAANQAYERETNRHEVALDSIRSTISAEERDSRAIQSKAHDANRRYGAFQSRINELILATTQNYVPRLSVTPIASWKGEGDQRTEIIKIESGLWRLSCKCQGADGTSGFSVTIFDADSGKPFTRISDIDFLRMRTRIFDEPGSYYFMIEQGVHGVSYAIEVCLMTEE